MPITATTASWLLETAHVGYAIGLNDASQVTHRYWGSRLLYSACVPIHLENFRSTMRRIHLVADNTK